MMFGWTSGAACTETGPDTYWFNVQNGGSLVLAEEGLRSQWGTRPPEKFAVTSVLIGQGHINRWVMALGLPILFVSASASFPWRLLIG